MGSYLLKRLALSLFTVWAALTLMFLLIEAMPGDAVDARAGEKAVGSAIEANLRAKYGLDDAMPVRYGRFFVNLAQGDLGYSFKNDRSVNTDFKETFKNSLRLLVWGGIVQIGGSLTLGLLSAARQGSFGDRITTILSVAAQAIPVFVSGLLFQVFFGVIPFNFSWSWLNFNRLWDASDDAWRFMIFPKEWKVIVLPAITVGIVQMAFLARLLRSSMLEVLRADYLRTAAAKGLSRRSIILKHGLRNALIPYITAAGLALVEIFGIAVQTETVFGIFGIGSKIAESALIQDAPVILGLSSIVIVTTALVTLLIDLSYSVIDPRIRVGEKAR
jgi:oligopeptide transport system permease protein